MEGIRYVLDRQSGFDRLAAEDALRLVTHLALPGGLEDDDGASDDDRDRADWDALVVRARVEGSLAAMRVFLNVRANAPGNDPSG